MHSVRINKSRQFSLQPTLAQEKVAEEKVPGEKLTGEDGAIILLVGILSVVLIGFVSLAIDLYLYSSQKSGYEYTAEQIALSAIKAYFSEIDAGRTVAFAKQAALTAAETIALENVNRDVTMRFVQNRNAGQADLGLTMSAAGEVKFGTWDFSASRAGTCRGGGCFVEAASEINAVRIEFRVPDASPLRAMFGRAVGYSLPTFSVFSSAALIPRHLMFLVDLSRSITRDNYRSTQLRVSTAPGRIPAAEFAFDMSEASSGQCRVGSPYNYHTMGMPEPDALKYGNLYDRANNAGALANDYRVHLKRDYRCFEIPGTNGAKFAISTKKGTDPEPMRSILEGIHSAMDLFASRSAPGDMIGLLGFDDEILPQRKFDLVEAEPGNPKFRKLKSVVDTSTNIASRVEHYFFPRYWGSKTFLRFNSQTNSTENLKLQAMSDLYLGLNEAKTMLQSAPGYSDSQNTIVMFSDGLHNCPSGYRIIDPSFPCRDDDTYVQRALLELGVIRDQFLDEGIVLHTFLSGSNSGPHILLRKAGSSGGCMWPESVKYDAYWNSRMVNYRGGTLQRPPYFMPNYLYIPTTSVGGTWAPLVSPCTAGTSIQSDLDQVCRDANGGRGAIVIDSRYTDSSGRLGCDYKGRSKRQQVDDLIQSISSSNPYVLVE